MKIKEAIETGHDLLINKSRDEGATWLITSMFFLYWLLVPDSVFLVASRKEDLVDKAGNRDCLFYRFLYLNQTLPSWCQVPNAIKTHLHFENPNNGSLITGESTNISFGAGTRALAVMLDEFGRVDANTAQSIRETVSDVSPCVIYNSTHFFGRGHPFAKVLYSGKVPVIWLPWYRNPVKNPGLYRSPDLNRLEILDIDYYKYYYPKIDWKPEMTHSDLETDMLLSYPEIEISFKAVGDNKLRAPWYDSEEDRRDPRDMAQNVDMNPIGSGDCFFDPEQCLTIRQKFVKEPKYKGEVEYEVSSTTKITDVKFHIDAGRKCFKWWGELRDGRPPQEHNYIVACDISMGVGASNSVAGVYDVNLGEKVGMFVSPDVGVEEFADQAIAICYWAGGANGKPFLVWEANGPGGAFGKRVRWHNYYSVFTMRMERHKQRIKQSKFGWYSNREAKYDLLLELRIALSAGLRNVPGVKKLIVHDDATVTEYEDYIFYESGELGLSTCLDESSGAKSAHGDRVIPDGLFILALTDQPKASLKESAMIMEGSLAWRRQRFLDEQKRQLENSPWLVGGVNG